MSILQKFVLPIVLLVIFIIPLGVSGYYIYDRGEILLHSDQQTAVLQHCKSERMKVRKRRGGMSSGTFYRAYAETENGDIVKANLAMSSKTFCKRNIGKTVKVFVHRTDKTRSKLNTFLQFWLTPLVWISVTSLFGWVFIDGLRKGYWGRK